MYQAWKDGFVAGVEQYSKYMKVYLCKTLLEKKQYNVREKKNDTLIHKVVVKTLS